MGDAEGTNRLELKEARRSLDAQIDKIESVDQLAVSLFRINILFAGLLLTGLSVTVQSKSVDPQQFLNFSSLVGSFVLWIALMASAMTYTSSSIDLGVAPQFFDNDHPDDPEELSEGLVDRYQNWMRHNSRIYSTNRYLITLSLITTFSAVNLFVAGAASAFVDADSGVVLDVAFCLLALIVSGIAGVVVWFAQIILPPRE